MKQACFYYQRLNIMSDVESVQAAVLSEVGHHVE